MVHKKKLKLGLPHNHHDRIVYHDFRGHLCTPTYMLISISGVAKLDNAKFAQVGQCNGSYVACPTICVGPALVRLQMLYNAYHVLVISPLTLLMGWGCLFVWCLPVKGFGYCRSETDMCLWTLGQEKDRVWVFLSVALQLDELNALEASTTIAASLHWPRIWTSWYKLLPCKLPPGCQTVTELLFTALIPCSL